MIVYLNLKTSKLKVDPFQLFLNTYFFILAVDRLNLFHLSLDAHERQLSKKVIK